MTTHQLTRQECANLYSQVLKDKDEPTLRELCLTDLFFLLYIALRRSDAYNDFVYERCREVESAPDGFLDLWAREHYKSTIITFAKTIQDILKDPDVTVGIFSHTRPIAKAFLKQIMREFEDNTFLQDLFPEILYKEPKRESPVWSMDNGIVVRRKSNPKESTVEAHGLVDGQPTSKHFSILNYDDVVTRESVTTPEQMEKVTDAFALSLNLGAKGGRIRGIGTRYHYNDTYRMIIERDILTPRIHAATEDGTVNGPSVFLSRDELNKKRKGMGAYIFACQMLQDPKEDSVMGFKEDWLRYYDNMDTPSDWNYYITVDPAGEKKKLNDYTVMIVHALAPDNNYYLIAGYRDRLSLTERTELLFKLVRKYQPVRVGYEKYGMQSDIEHIEYVMDQQQYRFKIVPLGGQMPKNDRIRQLVPIFEYGRYILPRRYLFKDYEGAFHDFVDVFRREEYSAFPVAIHDDMFDCMARIVDPGLLTEFPTLQERVTHQEKRTAHGDYKVL